MEETGCDEHIEVVATRRNGETTSAPVFGLVMVTLASAGAAQTRGAIRSKMKFFMEFTLLRFDISEYADSARKITLARAVWRN
jgi:hypothetical protein